MRCVLELIGGAIGWLAEVMPQVAADRFLHLNFALGAQFVHFLLFLTQTHDLHVPEGPHVQHLAILLWHKEAGGANAAGDNAKLLESVTIAS